MGGADGPSSSGRNSRPSTGVTPNVRKNPLVTLRPGTRFGPEGVVTVKPDRTSWAAIESNARLRALQSMKSK